MDLGYIAPCPSCGGNIKLISVCSPGSPDCAAICKACRSRFPFAANLKTYRGARIYASSIRKAVRLWNNKFSKS